MVDGDITKTDYILKQKYRAVLNWLVLMKNRNEKMKDEMTKNKVL